MKYRERDIKFEQGKYWVLDTGNSYAVMKNETTHSVSDSEYLRDVGGLSIAKARVRYLALRAKECPCSKCGAKLQPVWLKDGICNGCRNPELIVVCQPAAKE